jgi:Holliday junction DNA helicase RuvB
MIENKNLEIFTPKNFQEFIGQNQAKKVAQIIVKAAKAENRRIPNILIDGEYGLGKTTLAQIILKSLGLDPVLYDSASLNRELPELKGTIIIDEVHNLEPQICDSLNILLDRGDFSVIGCTTKPGALPMAFKSRFRSIHLVRYTNLDLTTILDASCLRKSLTLNPAVLRRIAERSRGNTRIALNYLSFIFDMLASRKSKAVTMSLVNEAFDLLEVDNIGLQRRDKEYLATIPIDRAVGIQYISARMGLDAETIETEIEPYLMQLGLVDRTNKGRIRVG